jgi:hypothetical protein
MVLILAMLMTMFAGLGAASAATGYSASDVPLVVTDTPTVAQRVGSIIITFDNLPAVQTPVPGANKSHQFIVKLPDSFDIDSLSATVVKPDPNTVVDVRALYQGTALPIATMNSNLPGVSTNQLLFEVYASQLVPELKLAIDLTTKVPASAPETINALIIGESGSVFTDGAVQVAKTSGASVTALGGDPVTITGGGIADSAKAKIYLRENKAGALLSGAKSFTLKLPQGFAWDKNKTTFATLGGLNEFTMTQADDRTLEFKRDSVNLPGSIWLLEASDIIVDESVAKFGDVVVTIGGASAISPDSVTIGKYADYGVEVNIDDPETEVLAGRSEQYISDIEIKELIGDSLLPGRTIYMELPSGFRWMDGSWNKVVSGGIAIKSMGVVDNKPELLKIVFNTDPGPSKGTLEINRAQIEIAGNIANDTDVMVKFWGNAGIEEELAVAKVVAPISVTADVKDIKIGLQNQAAGNIVITEAQAEAIDSWIYGTGQTALNVVLPFNVTWGAIPTVKVIEGDLELGTITRDASNRTLVIPIKTSSSVASKIEISDIFYTADRTVPEGDMEADFGGDAVVQTNFVNRNYITSEVVANCVTPAPGETIGSGEFRIGSNIYYAGGVAKVMDVAPYIKDSRTYVPMRYLGEILGAEVVWDDAARTVTLTKADTTVVFTIGSTSYTVNGEAKTADVAPEITNSRTMLPARFVAEAFGAVVGWDAATQTVLIQK